ncbi:PorT family protein [Pontibacter sp. BT310]|uniref:PorT family protein n=2 Tax=Hymenobacteraceae TaxID=1853232 RepID=A0ABS6XGB1_9BACT|nr:PorT family protein [Pontibacter sp. BT310]MBW3366684.1 PorT family protein [Pontibacter populi]
MLFAGVTAAQAQSGIGIRGGANMANLSGDLRNEDNFENKWGFHGGITYNIGIVDNFFSIQPELLYSQKGFKNADTEFVVGGVNYKRTGKVNYNYLDLPVLAKIKAGPLYFEAGPQASYLIGVNNETKTYLDGNLQSTSRDEKDKEGLKEFEFGYGAGVGFALGNSLNLGVRYNGSFSDFVDEDVNFNGDVTNARHSTIMFTLGLTIPSAR